MQYFPIPQYSICTQPSPSLKRAKTSYPLPRRLLSELRGRKLNIQKPSPKPNNPKEEVSGSAAARGSGALRTRCVSIPVSLPSGSKSKTLPSPTSSPQRSSPSMNFPTEANVLTVEIPSPPTESSPESAEVGNGFPSALFGLKTTATRSIPSARHASWATEN